MLAVTIRLEVLLEHLAVFRAAATKQAEVTRQREHGCLRFDVAFDPDISTRCLIYTAFRDDGAYDHHIATDYYATFEDLSSEWAEKRVVEFWDVAASGRRGFLGTP